MKLHSIENRRMSYRSPVTWRGVTIPNKLLLNVMLVMYVWIESRIKDTTNPSELVDWNKFPCTPIVSHNNTLAKLLKLLQVCYLSFTICQNHTNKLGSVYLCEGGWTSWMNSLWLCLCQKEANEIDKILEEISIQFQIPKLMAIYDNGFQPKTPSTRAKENVCQAGLCCIGSRL